MKGYFIFTNTTFWGKFYASIQFSREFFSTRDFIDVK